MAAKADFPWRRLNVGDGHEQSFAPSSSSASELFVSNTLISDNAGIGVNIVPTGSGAIKGVVDHVEIKNNASFGLFASTSNQVTDVTVSESVSANNSSGIVAAVSGTGVANIMVRNCAITNNSATGLEASGSLATIRFTRVTITGNATGSATSSGGNMVSFNDNSVDGNTLNGIPTAFLGYQ